MTVADPLYHIQDPDWIRTQSGDPRGYIDSPTLRELWFHTGTICNLSCPFCFEGSRPGDDRLGALTLDDIRPFVESALELGVEQFSFTGGEPFVVKDMVRILDHALEFRSCLVLTNGTDPLLHRLDEIRSLAMKPHDLKFRVSFDYPDAAKHDAQRGAGNFQKALECLGHLHRAGFSVSIARQALPGEDRPVEDAKYHPFLDGVGVPRDINVVAFPNFLTPGARPDVPQISEDCMTRYQTARTRADFMCGFSRMIVKRGGRMRVFACTLVDDDESYDLGDDLAASLRYRIMLRHHRCYSCFSFGASCSEA